jgi:hypothetical protein
MIPYLRGRFKISIEVQGSAKKEGKIFRLAKIFTEVGFLDR